MLSSGKKKNILTLLSEKKILNETKNHFARLALWKQTSPLCEMMGHEDAFNV
jgi:hypothetical protein